MADGYHFRDRWGQPRSINSDDVWRVVANWRIYAGLVGYGRATGLVSHEQEDAASVLHDTGCAVFDLVLLKVIATVHEKRSLTTRPVRDVAKGTHFRAVADAVLRALRCRRDA